MMLRLLSALALLHLALGDSTTQTEVDFTESLNQANLPLLQSVEKSVEVDYLYNLYCKNTWTQFLDMAIIWDLQFSQRVNLQYTISIGTSSDCWFATTLMIDGVEIRRFRYHSLTQYHSVFRSGSVFLSAGHHRTQVLYRTSCDPNYSHDPKWDWPAASFNVLYHRTKPN